MAVNNSIKLDWVSEFVSSLPKIKHERKDIISIAGYPSWENVNSNLLSFYFDENEEHKFYRLFINSLLDVYDEKTKNKIEREVFESNFSVDREVKTNSNKRIDILIKELSSQENWSIIIENKIYAELYNNLGDYWDSVDSKYKIGIVLSIKPTNIPGKYNSDKISFINILHIDLLNKVIQNLPAYYEKSDDRHLLLLKEYILNINTHYKNTIEMDETLKLFQSKKDDIKKLISLDDKLLKYVSDTVTDVMSANGYEPSSRRSTSKGKHFYVKDSKFRFWVDFGKLKYENHFIAYFELWGNESTKYGDKLKETLKDNSKLGLPKYIQIGSGGRSGSAFQHIYKINIPVEEYATEGFKETIKKLLETYVFGKNNFINSALSEYDRIK